MSEAKREASSPTEAGTTTNIVTSINIDRDRKDDKEKIPPKRSRKTRKQKESLQYRLAIMTKLSPCRLGKFRKYRGNHWQHAFFYYTVKLLPAADRTDGSRWAAAVDQASPEADERASWIKLDWKRGSERTTFIPRYCSSSPIIITHSSGAPFLGLRCYRKKPDDREAMVERQSVTNGAATQPHPAQPHRDGEWAQPCTKSRDGSRWRSGSQVGKSLEYRSDMPRISDIYAILKRLKHVQCITCNHRCAVILRFSIER